MPKKNGHLAEIRKHLRWMFIYSGSSMPGILSRPKPLRSRSKVGFCFTIWYLVFAKQVFYFSDCGITIYHDGSEDNQVHCFKEHGPIPEGLFELQMARQLGKQDKAVEEVDAEEDEENGYMSDESLEFENDDYDNELNAPNPEFHRV